MKCMSSLMAFTRPRIRCRTGGSVVSRLYGIALSAETPFKLHWSPLNYLLPFAFAAAKAALCCCCCCSFLRLGSFCPPPHHRDPGACSQHCFLLPMAM